MAYIKISELPQALSVSETADIPVVTGGVTKKATPSQVAAASELTITENGVDVTNAVPRLISDTLGDFVSVKDFGAVGDGVTEDALAIQNAINNFGNVFIPDGTYIIDADLIVPNNVVIEFSKKAVFKASADNRTFFKSITSAYFSQIWNANLDGNNKTGVTGFDMTNFRLQSGLFNPFMTNLTNGIIFRYGCFDTTISNPTTFNNVPYPIRLIDNTGGVRITNPNLDNTGLLTGSAIVIEAGTTATTSGVIVEGGYCQGFVTGIIDRGWGTKITGTYFEQCSSSDILADSARNYIYEGTQHFTSSGNSGIQGVSSDGGYIVAPLMTSGGRSIGLFNFDGTNTNCYYINPKSNASINTPIGVTTGVRSIWGSPQAIGDVSPNTGAFTTLSSSGVATLSGLKTASGNVTTTSGVASTIFTMSGTSRGRYEVVALIPNSGGASQYTAIATAIWDGSGARIISNNGSNLTLTLSGGSVQVTQSAGSAQTVYWSYLFIVL